MSKMLDRIRAAQKRQEETNTSSSSSNEGIPANNPTHTMNVINASIGAKTITQRVIINLFFVFCFISMNNNFAKLEKISLLCMAKIIV